jgi:putative tricarboxylic transport membrane protein
MDALLNATATADLLHVIMGIMAGFLSGLVPGVGNTIMLFMLYPLLMDSSLFQMLVFYLGLASVSQFSGSVMATVFGVPGESSSLPAVREGKRLFERGLGNFAISSAAMGSVFGSLVSTVIVLGLLPFVAMGIMKFYGANVQFFLLWTVTLSVCALLGTSWWQNLLVFVLGGLLGMVGDMGYDGQVFAPDVIPYARFPMLYEGIPLFPVVVALFVLPTLWQTRQQFKGFRFQPTRDYRDDASLGDHLREWWSHRWSTLRGSAYGAMVGLMPYISTMVASNTSYAFEKKRAIRNGTYREDGHMDSLVAAETANNSCILVQLMPLLLLSVPMTGAETVLLSIIEINNHVVNWRVTLDQGLFQKLALWFIPINVAAILLCWPAVKHVNLLKRFNMDQMLCVTALILIGLVFYTGSQQNATWYFFAVTVILMPLGYLLRRTETLILLIAFILQDKLLQATWVFYNIHFG